MLEKVDFTMLPDGRVLDLRPMYENKSPLVFEDGTWVIFKGNPKEVIGSRPIDNASVRDLTSISNLLQ
jgi:hypothetical protein